MVPVNKAEWDKPNGLESIMEFTRVGLSECRWVLTPSDPGSPVFQILRGQFRELPELLRQQVSGYQFRLVLSDHRG